MTISLLFISGAVAVILVFSAGFYTGSLRTKYKEVKRVMIAPPKKDATAAYQLYKDAQ